LNIRKLLKNYFTYIYNRERTERRAVQENLMEHNPRAVVLDCGCREGDYTIRMTRGVGSPHLIGLDYTASVLKLAAQKGITPLRADLNKNIPLTCGSVDVILASDVLEHLVNPALFVSEMFRVLRPGGYLILDTPNLASWHNIFALLVGVQPFSGPNITNMEDAEIGLVREMHRSDHGLPEQGENIEQPEQELTRHIVVVAYRSLVNLVKRTGFKITLVRGFGYYPFPPFIARWMQRLDPAHSHHVLVKAVKP
jgi:ubiquinone/menaquinone biosynthesis C-methylase UbiE